MAPLPDEEPRSAVLSSPSRFGLAKCLRAEQLCTAAAATQGARSRCPLQRTDHALSRGHRQRRRRSRMSIWSRACRAFLQSINYQDGTFVKEGTTLFTIEPETYKFEARAGAGRRDRRAGVAEAGRSRFQAAVGSGAKAGGLAGDARITSTSTRDNAQANLQQAQVNTKIAAVNYGYTNVVGAVRRHRQRASGLGRRTGRRVVADASLRPSCSSIRST